MTDDRPSCLTLEVALERYSDPALWAELKGIGDYRSFVSVSVYERLASPEKIEKEQQWIRLREYLEREFEAKLVRGDPVLCHTVSSPNGTLPLQPVPRFLIARLRLTLVGYGWGKSPYETNTAKCDGVSLNGLRVLPQGVVPEGAAAVELPPAEKPASENVPTANPDRTSSPYSRKKLREWYERRIAENQASGQVPSRDDDWAAAREALGDGVPRSAVRALRRELAPRQWRARGRRKASAK